MVCDVRVCCLYGLYGLGTRRPRRVKSWGPDVRSTLEGPGAAGPPELVSSGNPDSSESDSEEPVQPPSLRTLAAESKILYREVIKYSSSPKVVDLSVARKKREGEDKSGKAWLPRKKTPAYQVWERKMEGEKLGRKLQGLLERTSAIANRA